MVKGFKDFLMRGNVIDLAVAVVIGAAFTAIVTTITENLITPIINSIGSGDPAGGLSFSIRGTEATTINFGLIIGAAINFVIVAAVVYFIFVMPMNVINERRAKAVASDPEPPAIPIDTQLLTEIRDLLASGQVGNQTSPAAGRHTDPPA